eukprot:TRINITY_DN9119_c0_g2_i1.p1 TRINITY_DN9119_c0_g2~~TRINITY_DN9119_c0_g2_i1.p1  ORF type:complete len:299 (+),score=82.52 TRINITY_DN9119_c0_g2_i1:69-899(+)
MNAMESRIKQYINEKFDESFKNSTENLKIQNLTFQSDSRLRDRLNLPLSESVSFLSTIRLKNNDSFQEAMDILKSNSNFKNLESKLNDINIWYEGWKFEDKNPFGLTEEETKSISLYTHNSYESQEDNFSFQLNNALRKREFLDMKSLEGYLYFFYKAMDKLPNCTTTIYRGFSKDLLPKIEKEYKVDRPIHWSGFSSGTPNIQDAKEFAGENGIIIKIQLQSGKSIENYSLLPQEKEILLSPFIQFKVVEPIKKENDGYFIVTLVEHKIIPPLIL